MDLKEGNENCRGTKEGEDVPENLTKFTVPSFKEQLWKHAISAIVPVPEIDALFQEIVAVVRICIWRKFQDAFELQDCVGEILLVDPDCPPEKRANIQRNVTRRRSLHQYAHQSAVFIGQRYAKLLSDGDKAGREKLEKLISSIERRFCETPGGSMPVWRKWHFFTALAALEFLERSVVPTRKKVIEGAVQARAAFELQLGFGNSRTRYSRIITLHVNEPADWKRIIRDLELVGLPRKEYKF
jgi:hypothetical protein